MPRRLAKRISSCALVRSWVTVPGAASTLSTNMVWIESITSRRGALRLVEGRQDVAHRGRGGDLERRVGAAEAGGAQADLVDRFLAADVGDLGAGGGERAAGLEHERRLADAGIAADQDRGALDQAAAQHAVELGDRAVDRRGGAAAVPLSWNSCRRCGSRRRRRPFGTALGAVSSASVFHSPQASQRPAHFGMDRAAALADVLMVGPGHARSRTPVPVCFQYA